MDEWMFSFLIFYFEPMNYLLIITHMFFRNQSEAILEWLWARENIHSALVVVGVLFGETKNNRIHV
jgi:hypothetical protein